MASSPCWSTRAQKYALSFRAGKLGSLLSLRSHFLESGWASPRSDSRWGCLTELADIGFHWALWSPVSYLLPLRRPCGTEYNSRFPDCRQQGPKEQSTDWSYQVLTWKMVCLELVVTTPPCLML